MSSAAPPPAVPSSDQPFLKFPPWPQPIPQLGELISFKDFKPMGLLPPFQDADSDSDAEEGGDEPRAFPKGYRKMEVDGAGIPTVDINVDHDPSRHTKYKRNASKKGILRVDDLFGIGGEEPVATRGGVPYDPLLHPLTRVYRATKEWEVSRKFALGHTYNNIWCHWIRYAQIVKPLEKKNVNGEVPDLIDDDSDDEIVEDENGFIFHPEPDFISPEEGGECRFLKDIQGTVRIWLSFEFKDAGLAWLDQQLLGAPLVTKSYLLYLLAHGVLPERISELEKAVKVCEMAERDMLATKDIAVALEDGFNKLCSRVWGTGLLQERNNGWSTAAPDTALEEDQDDDGNEDAVLLSQVGNLDLNSIAQPPPASLLVGVEPPPSYDSTIPTTSLPPLEPSSVDFLASDPLPPNSSSSSPTPVDDNNGGSGWDLDPNETLHSLSFAPPLVDLLDDSSSPTPTTSANNNNTNTNLFDDGGWGVSPALLIDPIKALFPPSSTTTTTSTSTNPPSSTYLTHPFSSYKPLYTQLSLLRIIDVPPSSSSSSIASSHELAREGGRVPKLGALILEPWDDPVPAPFGEIIALEGREVEGGEAEGEGERKKDKDVAPREAFVPAEEDGKEGRRIVLWVDEEAVKGKVRAGVGIFGRFVWVGREEGGGFWFVDGVEAVIAEYWLAPENLTVE